MRVRRASLPHATGIVHRAWEHNACQSAARQLHDVPDVRIRRGVRRTPSCPVHAEIGLKFNTYKFNT